MLVLDESLSAALLSIAASEQLAAHTADPQALYLDPHTSRFLAKGSAPELRQQVLWDLLLHYPASLSPFDKISMDGLEKLGLVQGQIDSDAHNAAYRTLTASPEAVRGLQQLIHADIVSAHPGSADIAVERFLRLQASRGHAVERRMDSALLHMYPTYEEYVSGVSGMFSGCTFSLPGEGHNEVSGSLFGEQLAAGICREDFEAFKDYAPHCAFVNDFLASAHRWLALTYFSRSTGAVMSAKIPRSLATAAAIQPPGGLAKQLQLSADQGSTHAAVRIWMDEVQFAPKLRSIEDVVRLRDDKRINAFRTAMLEWTQALATGIPAEEKRLRKLVGVANKEVAKLEGIEKMSAFFTFASIPLDILLGLNPVTSLPITGLIGAGIYVATKFHRKPLDWVMFGSS